MTGAQSGHVSNSPVEPRNSFRIRRNTAEPHRSRYAARQIASHLWRRPLRLSIHRLELGAIVDDMRVFVAGATGAVGFEFVRLAKAGGCFIQTLSLSPENARKLAGLADQVEVQDVGTGIPSLEGIDAVVSSLGAPVTFGSPEKRPYREVDLRGNKRILDAAKAAGVRRFLYVAAHVEPGYQDTAYIRAHEEFVSALRLSGLNYSVIRPTGIFAAFSDFVSLARKGLTTVIGDGRARTNPVHQADVAGRLLEHLDFGPDELSVGGPETFTRLEIAELAFAVLGKRPRVFRIPALAFRLGAKVVGLKNPRLGELLEFVAAVSVTDCVAPSIGQLRLEDYLRRVAG